MTDAHRIHCYEYVNRPYEQVSEALVLDAVGIFQRATVGATGRAAKLVSTLKVDIAGVEVGKDVVIHVTRVNARGAAPGHLGAAATRLVLEWQADTNASLFPAMHAELAVYPLSSGETQLELTGTYDPPGGVLGGAADRLLGRKVAEAAVHRFVEDVARELSAELG